MALGFPGLAELNRRTVRGPVNPLDKTTIFSIYPKKVRAIKLTLTPGVFYLPPGSTESPSHLVVGPPSWWKEINEREPLLEISQSSIQIADSIVTDFCNGIFGCDMGNAKPGLFYIPGEWNPITAQVKHPELFTEAAERQKRYYQVLIDFGDAIWATGSGNPMLIIDEMRVAARETGNMDKDWMKTHVQQGQVRCAACGAFKNPLFPVCQTCKAIDQNHPAAANIKFAV